MCGRFSNTADSEMVAKRFQVKVNQESWRKRYNAAPTQLLPVVTSEQQQQVNWLRWGLIPRWAKDSNIGSKFINARSETIMEKKTFAPAFRKRRCLIPADGFYEWQKISQKKKPYRFTLKNKELFAFAGLWAIWKNASGQEIRSFTILTTKPNELVAPIHDRMPFILAPEQEKMWLDLKIEPEQIFEEILQVPRNHPMVCYAVSPRVNAPANDDPQIIESQEDSQQMSFF